MKNHTPTPWKVKTGSSDYGLWYVQIVTDEDHPKYICNVDSKEAREDEKSPDEYNAAFIVRAVNAYEKDQETIKALLEALKDAHEHLDYCSYGDKWERECARASKLPEKIENTIAQAEGGE